MKRTALALFLLLVPALTLAAEQVWTPTTTGVGARSVKGVCAAGACDAPSDATKGMSATGVSKVTIQVCAESAATIPVGTGVILYHYSIQSQLWGQVNATACTMKTGVRCAMVQCDMPTYFIAVAPIGRFAAVVTGGNAQLTVWIDAADANGNSK